MTDYVYQLYSAHYNQSFLQNPYYFMYASLANPDRDEELHLLKDGKTRCTTGSVVSSLYHLKDPEADSESIFSLRSILFYRSVFIPFHLVACLVIILFHFHFYLTRFPPSILWMRKIPSSAGP